MSAEHLDSLSNDALREAAITASDDLAKAAADQPNSEWHEACFAGVLIYAAEMQQRGLKIETVH
jgi:hypothetical protein